MARSTLRKEFMFLISTLVPSSLAPRRPDRDVGVAAEAAFLHVAVADLEVPQERAQLAQVGAGLGRGAHVRLADDLEQRHAGSG